MNRFISYACSMMLVSVGFADAPKATNETFEGKQDIAKRCEGSVFFKKTPPCPTSKNNAEGSRGNQSVKCGESRRDRSLPEDKYLAGYNVPANIKLGENCDRAAFYVDGSYLYWYASQSNMNIAHSFIATSGSAGVPQSRISELSQPFHYQSAFKVGGGVEKENWSIDVNYLWIRQHTSISKAAPAANPAAGTGVWQVEGWYIQTPPTVGVIASTVSSKWELGMDVGDLVFGRSFYFGPRFVAAPYCGLSGGSIRQSLDILSSEVLVTGAPPYPIVSHNHSLAWVIGPKMGTNLSYLLPQGLRLEGTLAGSLLYQRYQEVTHREDTQFFTTPVVVNPTLKLANFSTLAPVLEMGLGFGWGWYFGHSAYLDLSASYDFGVWWRQNYMRQLVTAYQTGGGYPGELFLHGGTATVKVAF